MLFLEKNLVYGYHITNKHKKIYYKCGFISGFLLLLISFYYHNYNKDLKEDIEISLKNYTIDKNNLNIKDCEATQEYDKKPIESKKQIIEEYSVQLSKLDQNIIKDMKNNKKINDLYNKFLKTGYFDIDKHIDICSDLKKEICIKYIKQAIFSENITPKLKQALSKSLSKLSNKKSYISDIDIYSLTRDCKYYKNQLCIQLIKDINHCYDTIYKLVSIKQYKRKQLNDLKIRHKL